jgi:dihydroorotase
MDALLITNARIVNEGQTREGDVLILDGKIEKIAPEIHAQGVSQVLDAEGRTLIPGMIDANVHFREPDDAHTDADHRGTIYTESRAAVAGGVTSYMDMPDTSPRTVTVDLLEEKYRIAEKSSVANYSFYLGASRDNIETIKGLDPLSACGVKVFMGGASGNTLVDDPVILENVFQHSPILIAAHCEDMPSIMENEESYRQIYGDEIPFHLHASIRSHEACYQSSSLAVNLAKQYDADLHVLHISTEKELDLFSQQAISQKKITADTCVHFLAFSDDDYANYNGLIKTHPAIKSAEDRAAIMQALLEGRLDLIASDHAPQLLADKQQSYFNTPAGIPGVQYAIPLLLEYYHDEIFTLEFIVEKTSHAVADRFQIKDRGYIREGYWADLVLLDLNDVADTISNENVIAHCGWTPYADTEIRSSVYATLVNGHIVWRNGLFRDVAPGMRLAFER